MPARARERVSDCTVFCLTAASIRRALNCTTVTHRQFYVLLNGDSMPYGTCTSNLTQVSDISGGSIDREAADDGERSLTLERQTELLLGELPHLDA